jgi:hypothetical protein
MKDKLFYRYIYKQGNGYRIIKDNEHWGWYDDLRLALFDRDMLEQVEWDMVEFLEIPDTIPNPYLHMELPPFEERKATYIQHLPEKWRVQKRIKGKLSYFGTFDTEEEAIRHRDKLLKERIL